ncbi:sulfatase [Nocardioides sp. WS12]|uniref:sulfatase family protein n=1 Tax=Nocardioides sp. WS12 TaxID=2486272 RepID=UPI0015F9544A|nr:sulfatase [Nocardioides sp. WS12]
METSIVKAWFRVVVVGVIVALVGSLVVVALIHAPGSGAGKDPVVEPVVAGPVATAAADEPARPVAFPKQPNVVLVMADDMRVDDLAFAPNLRKLIAEHGVTFENSFAPFPLCCPSRASFLTGQYAHNHKVFWHDPPYGYGAFDDSKTIATSLQAAGYRTGLIGKYLNRYGLARSKVTGEPSARYVPNGWDDWRGAIEPPGESDVHGSTYDYMDTPFNVNGTIDNNYRGVYQSDVIGDMSVDMARRFAKARDPFFMYVNYVAPHHGGPNPADEPVDIKDEAGHEVSLATPAVPDWVRGKFDDLIDRGSGVAKTGEAIETDVSDKPPALRKRIQPLGDEAKGALLDVTRRRAEAIYVMDRNIARLVAELQRSGAWEETVFAFTSDNGMLLGEHGLGMTKVRAHEPSLRVPMLVTGPGLRTEQKRYDPISTVDLTATILDVADAKPSHKPDGVSRADSLLYGDQGWSTPVVTEAVFTSRGTDPAFLDMRSTIGIRVSRYSYTRYNDGATELYDLVEDPREDQNVADDPRYADARAALDELWPRVKDCRGKACAPDLDRVLTADPKLNASNTDAYWDEIVAAYGWGK